MQIPMQMGSSESLLMGRWGGARSRAQAPLAPMTVTLGQSLLRNPKEDPSPEADRHPCV